jgi:hypothetical protein
MAGFNIPLPLTAFTPQMLAEMAQRAFRPPALMGGGGGGGGGMGGGGAAAPGFDVQGAAGAAKGLGMLGAQLFNDKGIDAEIKDWSSYGTPAGRASLDNMLATSGGQMIGPSNASFGDLGGPGGTYGGGLADGGPVMPGQYYTVGERGPETFVPAVPGQIVPNEERDFFGGRRRR